MQSSRVHAFSILFTALFCFTKVPAQTAPTITGSPISAPHALSVRGVAVTPDGQTIVSGSVDNTIKVWRLSDGALVRTLQSHTAAVTSVAATPDGQTVVSGSDDNTIKVWRFCDGQLLRTLTGHTNRVWRVAVTQDGENIVSGSWDNTIKVWRLSDGQLLRTLPVAGSGDVGHTSYVYSVAVMPDGQTIVSGSVDHTIKVWRLSDGQLLRTLQSHTIGVASVAVTPDGSAIISGGEAADIWRWTVDPPFGTVAVEGTPRPARLSLSQNTPNPFNPATTIRFSLPEAGHVTLAVYDVNGRLVRNLVTGSFEAGQHEIVWDGCDSNGRAVASGVYMARLSAPQGVLTRRMVLAR